MAQAATVCVALKLKLLLGRILAQRMTSYRISVTEVATITMVIIAPCSPIMYPQVNLLPGDKLMYLSPPVGIGPCSWLPKS